jgi:glycosyltransferase involved in cell wall biosynthesis
MMIGIDMRRVADMKDIKMKSQYQYKTRPNLVFIVTAYNCENYIEECLESILRQRGENWRAIIVDDASQDKTWEKISAFSETNPERIYAVRNGRRKGKMENFVRAVKQCSKEDVIIELDGDDYLLGNDVALELAELHQVYDVVWTQHEIDYAACPDWHTWYSTGLPADWSRNIPWRPTLWSADMHPGHLRTFKCKYFDLIKDGHLKWGGEYVKSAADAVYFTPIIELTPPDYRYFYARRCMCYRITNINNTLEELLYKDLRAAEKQSMVSDYVKGLPQYEPICISTLFIPYNKPVNHVEELSEIIRRVKQIDRFTQICIGVNSFANLDPLAGVGVIHFYNVYKMFNNIFNVSYHVDPSKKIGDELFFLMGCYYLLKNTRVNRLVAVRSPDIFREMPETDIEGLIRSNHNGVQTFRRNFSDLNYLLNSISAFSRGVNRRGSSPGTLLEMPGN